MATPITALVIAIITLGLSQVCEAEPAEPVSLVVQLTNHAGIPAHLLSPAKRQVTRIYAAAGVRIVWKSDTATAQRLDVLLLSGKMIDELLGPGPSDPRVLAKAYREASRAYIFTERVFAMASKTDGNIGDALGNVIAHEMGHLLLPESGHSPTGIMRSGYEFRDLSARRFTAEQAATIRRELLAANRR